jgi:hypothetical protein
MSKYSSDIVDLIKDCVVRYFANKSYSYGGPIPKTALLSEANVNLFDIEFYDSIDLVYKNLDDCLPLKKAETPLPWDVNYVLNIIKECKSLGIPKDFQGGIILLHIKYCKGFKKKSDGYCAVA